MKTKWLAGSIIGVAAVIAAAAVLVVATGGESGSDKTAIRTQQGLAAALAGQGLGMGGDSTGAAPLAQAGADTVVSGGSGLPATGNTGVSISAGARSMDVKGGYGFAPGPLQQQSASGITVQGYGSATATADSATVEFYFSSSGYPDKPYPMPEPYPGDIVPSIPPTPGEATPITEDTLKPVIDAIKAAGVGAADIEFIGQQYPDPYYSSATLRVKVGDIDSLDGVIAAAQDAAAGLDGVMLNSSSVAYTVSDCTALEKAAMAAAVDDASERGAAFSEALGVGLGDVVGASHYSYSPYGGTACDQGFYGGPYPYPMGGMPYFEGQPSEVQVFANISVTYAIQ